MVGVEITAPFGEAYSAAWYTSSTHSGKQSLGRFTTPTYGLWVRENHCNSSFANGYIKSEKDYYKPFLCYLMPIWATSLCTITWRWWHGCGIWMPWFWSWCVLVSTVFNKDMNFIWDLYWSTEDCRPFEVKVIFYNAEVILVCSFILL